MTNCYLFLALTTAIWHLHPSGADYGDAGGPLAKSPRKKPISKTRTTAFPDVDDGFLANPSFVNENAEIKPEIIKKADFNVSSAAEKPNLFLASPGEYGDMCCWEPYKSQVLGDIAEGRAGKPYYGFIEVQTCPDPNDCLLKCTKEKCNYAVYFHSNDSAALYVVHKDKVADLETANFSKSDASDSYVRRCLRQYDVSSSCSDLVATDCPLCDEFLDFVTKFKKVYKGCEFIRRFEIFKLNKLKIAGLNEKRVMDDDASFTVTRFADKTHEEFVSNFTGAKEDRGAPSQGTNIQDPVLNVSGAQPLYLRFDWTDYGVIPTVRDQDECGSCYAFTSTDLVAAQFAIDHGQFGKAYTLAPQYIMDCFKEPAAYGCDGGRPVKVLESLSKCGGKGEEKSDNCLFPLESCLPYQNAANALCDKPSGCADAPKIKVEKYNMVDISDDYLEKQKMAALIERGALVVQVDASEAWQFYEEGVIRSYQCTNKTTHAVLVTGYDFGTAVPGYIIRNTWSDNWGAKGYVYLEAGVNACGVGQAVTYACTDNCDVSKGQFAKATLIPHSQQPPITAPASTPTTPPYVIQYTQPPTTPPSNETSPPPTAPPSPYAIPSAPPVPYQLPFPSSPAAVPPNPYQAATTAPPQPPYEPSTVPPSPPPVGNQYEPPSAPPYQPSTGPPSPPPVGNPYEPPSAPPYQPSTVPPSQPPVGNPYEPPSAPPYQPSTEPPYQPASPVLTYGPPSTDFLYPPPSTAPYPPPPPPTQPPYPEASVIPPYGEPPVAPAETEEPEDTPETTTASSKKQGSAPSASPTDFTTLATPLQDAGEAKKDNAPEPKGGSVKFIFQIKPKRHLTK